MYIIFLYLQYRIINPFFTTMIITVTNQKGGVAKTTSSLNIASILAIKHRVLLIDLDAQCDLSVTLSSNYKKSDINVLDFIKNDFRGSLGSISKNLKIIWGEGSIEAIKLTKTAFKIGLEHYKDNFDFIIIDTKPQKILSQKLTMNEIILSSSDYCLIPIDDNIPTVLGMDKLLGEINRIRSDVNKKLNTIGVFFANVNKRERLFKTLYQECREENPNLFLKTSIRKSTLVKQANAVGKSLRDFSIKSDVYNDYRNLTNEILTILYELNR